MSYQEEFQIPPAVKSTATNPNSRVRRVTLDVIQSFNKY